MRKAPRRNAQWCSLLDNGIIEDKWGEKGGFWKEKGALWNRIKRKMRRVHTSDKTQTNRRKSTLRAKNPHCGLIINTAGEESILPIKK